VHSQSHRFLCNFFCWAFHFKHDSAWLYNADPAFDASLTFTHSLFKRLLGEWLIWEDSDPNLTTTLDVAGHGDTSGFNLSAGDPSWFHGNEREGTKGDGVTANGLTSHSSPVLLPVLGSLWH
jgi:hypothetical protein